MLRSLVLGSIQIKEHWVIVQDLFVFLDSRSFRLLFRIVPVIVPHRSIGATIGANLRFIGAIIGAIGAIIGANIEFIGDIIGDMSPIIDDNTKFIGAIFYDIIYDTKRFTMTLVELSMTSNIDYLGTNN